MKEKVEQVEGRSRIEPHNAEVEGSEPAWVPIVVEREV